MSGSLDADLRTYRVSWRSEFWAQSPADAARKALDALQAPPTGDVTFHVEGAAWRTVTLPTDSVPASVTAALKLVHAYLETDDKKATRPAVLRSVERALRALNAWEPASEPAHNLDAVQ